MDINSGFLGQRPTFFHVRIAVASDHMDFVSCRHEPACHFKRPGAAVHLGGIKILMQIQDAHGNLILVAVFMLALAPDQSDLNTVVYSDAASLSS